MKPLLLVAIALLIGFAVGAVYWRDYFDKIIAEFQWRKRYPLCQQ